MLDFSKAKTPKGKATRAEKPVYALIKNGAVINTIVATAEFIETIKDQWQACVDITDMQPRPGLKWTYSVEAGTFEAPQ